MYVLLYAILFFISQNKHENHQLQRKYAWCRSNFTYLNVFSQFQKSNFRIKKYIFESFARCKTTIPFNEQYTHLDSLPVGGVYTSGKSLLELTRNYTETAPFTNTSTLGPLGTDVWAGTSQTMDVPNVLKQILNLVLGRNNADCFWIKMIVAIR